MKIALFTLKAIAFALTDLNYICILIVLGIMFYRKNKKSMMMQKMILGSTSNTPLELTLSQLVIGAAGGLLASLLLSYLGIIFDSSSSVYIIFIISILLMFINTRFICFSYSAAILGLISLIIKLVFSNGNLDSVQFLLVDTVAVMSMVGVLHIIEGILVMIDGQRGAIPVFTNKDNKIIGGFALKRYWAVPVALFVASQGQDLLALGEYIQTPNWWPIINTNFDLLNLKNVVLGLIPFYGVIGYSSVTFTEGKKEKAITSGVSILLYGILLIAVAQLARYGLVFEFLVIIFAPAAHEFMLFFQKQRENKGKPKYINEDEGLRILEVAYNSPAQEMGIKSGDILTEINNIRINEEKDLFEALAGDINFLWIKVKRNYKGSTIIKEFNYNKMNKTKRLGVLFVPKHMPNDSMIANYDKDNFKDVLDKMKKRDDDEAM